jgi:hypothetical protein
MPENTGERQVPQLNRACRTCEDRVTFVRDKKTRSKGFKYYCKRCNQNLYHYETFRMRNRHHSARQQARREEEERRREEEYNRRYEERQRQRAEEERIFFDRIEQNIVIREPIHAGWAERNVPPSNDEMQNDMQRVINDLAQIRMDEVRGQLVEEMTNSILYGSMSRGAEVAMESPRGGEVRGENPCEEVPTTTRVGYLQDSANAGEYTWIAIDPTLQGEDDDELQRGKCHSL